jgi:hypothetical protein
METTKESIVVFSALQNTKRKEVKSNEHKKY